MPVRLIRVLHVDDLEEEFILVRELLSNVEGIKFELHWAPDARTASQAIRDMDFDVCFVDYYLGKDNGLEFTRAALADGVMTPFILMSGQKDHSIDREALKIGVRQCIDKNDISTPILLKAIKAVTGN
jgi:two-component system, cell cycle sensor histidine kinase and response regulator CckA